MKTISKIQRDIKRTMLYVLVGITIVLFLNGVIFSVVEATKKIVLLHIILECLYIVATGILFYFVMKKSSLKQISQSKENNIECNLEESPPKEKLLFNEEELHQQLQALKESQENLKISEELYRLAMEATNDGIWDWDIQNNNVYLFKRTKEVLGYADHELEDTIDTWKKLLHPDDLEYTIQMLDQYLNRITLNYETEYRLKAKDGKYKWILSRGKALWDKEGKAIRLVGSHTDVTEKRKAEEKIYYLAYYDSLTGLPNKTFFGERFSVMLAEAKRKRYKIALMYLDVDQFKKINDLLGYDAGDLLLKEVAKRLKSCLRETDTIGRVSGDEFAILLSEINGKMDVVRVVERIIEVFQYPHSLKGEEVTLTTSIGISCYPEDGTTKQKLIKNASAAMSYSQKEGNNRFHFYDAIEEEDLEII